MPEPRVEVASRAARAWRLTSSSASSWSGPAAVVYGGRGLEQRGRTGNPSYLSVTSSDRVAICDVALAPWRSQRQAHRQDAAELAESAQQLLHAASARPGQIPQLAAELYRITVTVGARQQEGSRIRQPPGRTGRPCGRSAAPSPSAGSKSWPGYLQTRPFPGQRGATPARGEVAGSQLEGSRRQASARRKTQPA